MNRRDALRSAIAAGTAMVGVAGCDAARPSSSGQPLVDRSPRPSGTAVMPPSPVVLPPEITHGPRDRPAVALTFHGQGDPALVEQLLSRLAAGGARVTVMAVGSWLTAQPDMARRILDGGHELGNHTQHHLAIAQMDAHQAFTEIDDCAQVLRRLTGSIGRWFRPSQSPHSTPTIRAAATRVGYPTCLSYDVDSLDYTDPPAAAIVRTTLAAVGNGSIISMHCGHPATVTAIGPILHGLHNRGLRPVTMTELIGS